MPHINIKTSYEFLSSTILIPKLVKQAKALDASVLGIVDVNMHGAFQFYNACIKEGIKPIIGLSFTVESNEYLLYAKNLNGYQSLLKISSNIEFKRFDLLSLADEPNLFVVLKANESTTTQNLNEFVDYVGFDLTDFSFEVQVAPKLYAACLKENIKVIAVPEVRYLKETDKRYLNALEAIRDNNSLEENSLLGPSYLRKEPSLKEMYSDYPESILNLEELIDSIQVEIDYSGYLLPSYPTTYPSFDLLVALARKGLEKRLSVVQSKQRLYQERLIYELSVIREMGFVDYFLIVYDLVHYAKKQDIYVGPGRGSAAGSLVSYCLGITNVDPLEYDLLFERFLNPERMSMPDIDLDFPDDKRDQIIEYAVSKYGKNHVASIVTFGTFQGRSAIRDIAKVLRLPNTHLSELLKYIPQNAKNLEELAQDEALKHLCTMYPEIAQVIEYAIQIENIPRHSSTHAAGIIISDQDITTYSALQPGLLNMYQTQYEQKDLESIGLLKVDFLGLSNLKIIKRTCELIKKHTNIDIPLYDLTFDDPRVFQLLTNKETDGVFQLESSGIRNALHEVRVDSFEDIVAVLALYRPGPMENIPEYAARKQGKKFEYLHKDLQTILEPTYGIIIYQEQIIMLAHQFAGYTLSEADLLRRAISKKQKRLLESERDRFIDKCIGRGYNESTANTIYDYILKFANYGFNRSHSVAYAMIAYICAYLKVHYPIAFFSVLLSHSTGSERTMEKYIRECRKNSIDILAPSINKAHVHFMVTDDGIMMPFTAIKNVGKAVASKLIDIRREGLFKNFLDFVNRTKSVINSKILEQLIYASALDEFGLSKRAMIEQYDEVSKFAEYGSLIEELEFVVKDIPEYDEADLMKKEQLAYGINIQYHFLNPYSKIAHEFRSLNDLEEGQTIEVVARLNRKHMIRTKKGDQMAFITIEDFTQELEAVLFPTQFDLVKQFLKVNEVYKFTINQQKRNNKNSFIVEEVVKI